MALFYIIINNFDFYFIHLPDIFYAILSRSLSLSLWQFFFTESLLYRWLYTYVYVRSVGRHVSGERFTLADGAREMAWIENNCTRIRICVYILCLLLCSVCALMRAAACEYIHTFSYIDKKSQLFSSPICETYTFLFHNTFSRSFQWFMHRECDDVLFTFILT